MDFPPRRGNPADLTGDGAEEIATGTTPADRVAPLLLQERASQEPEVRYRAAMGLMLRGPESPSIVKAAWQWLLAADHSTRARLFSGLEHHSTDQHRQPPKPVLAARVLSALLEPALLDQDSATAEFTFCAFDGPGLRCQLPARPTLTPHIRFLSVGSRICSRLLSDGRLAATPL